MIGEGISKSSLQASRHKEVEASLAAGFNPDYADSFGSEPGAVVIGVLDRLTALWCLHGTVKRT